MLCMSAKDAKYGFGRLIDLARSEPVTVEKHGRAVVVVLSIEEYERLRDRANGKALPAADENDQVARRGNTEQA